MNFKFFMTFQARIFVTTLFFTGIVISAGALYILPDQTQILAFIPVYVIVGATFLTGLLSVHFTARSVKPTVVYLDRKIEKTVSNSTTVTQQGELSFAAIESIIRSGEDVLQRVIREICQQLEAGQGAIYVSNGEALALACGFALSFKHDAKPVYQFGEGLIGRVAADGNSLCIDQLPNGYVTVFSGLGSSSPANLAVVPIKNENEVRGVIELALFNQVNAATLAQLEHAGKLMAEIDL